VIAVAADAELHAHASIRGQEYFGRRQAEEMMLTAVMQIEIQVVLMQWD
jgi:hypothetical protein